MSKTHIQFLLEAKKVHGENRYQYLSQYSRWNIKIDIKCLVCGNLFSQRPNDHISGRGCPNCKMIKHLQRCNSEKLSLEEVIRRSKEKHNNYYEYSKSNYVNCNTKFVVTCPKHGDFIVKPYRHYKEGIGCPSCRRSKSELIIENWLKNKGIKFITQKRFKNAVTKEHCRSIFLSLNIIHV